MFNILVAATLVLAVAALLSGLLAGEEIMRALDSGGPALGMSPAPLGMAILMCGGALVCLAAGVSVGFMGMSNALLKSMVPGSIRSSSIRSFPSDGGTEYFVYSIVSYEVDGARFENEGCHRFSSTDGNAASEKLAGINPGDPVAVFYKPGDPDVIDLDSAPTDGRGSILAGAALIVIGLILLFMAGSSFQA
jgi:hypothetical protein